MRLFILTVSLFALSISWSQAQIRPPVMSLITEGTTLTVYWDDVVGADGYRIYYAPFPQADPVAFESYGPDVTNVFIEAFDGAAFYAAVAAVKGDEVSAFSNIDFFVLSPVDPADAQATESEVIANVAQTVIASNYAELERRAGALLNTVLSLNFETTDEHLLAAQQAWRRARRAWEQTEAFLFGPVDTEGLDPALDSWPVNRVDLEAVLASDNALTEGFVANLEDTLKGFHTIEFLLFGFGNTKVAADLAPREKEYLIAVTQNLQTATKTLADAWRPGEGSFFNELVNAGTTSTIYPSTTAALQELVEGLGIIADEVGNGKISDPFSETNPELVESQFSFNSIMDFSDNMRGIENVYIGRYLKNDGPGLSDLVRRINPQLDETIRKAITTAIAEIEGIPYPFRDSISTPDGRTQIEVATNAVADLQLLIEGELLNLLVNP